MQGGWLPPCSHFTNAHLLLCRWHSSGKNRQVCAVKRVWWIWLNTHVWDEDFRMKKHQCSCQRLVLRELKSSGFGNSRSCSLFVLYNHVFVTLCLWHRQVDLLSSTVPVIPVESITEWLSAAAENKVIHILGNKWIINMLFTAAALSVSETLWKSGTVTQRTESMQKCVSLIATRRQFSALPHNKEKTFPLIFCDFLFCLS